jgi:hypothetical protein
VGRPCGQGAILRNDPNNVCTYEYMNTEKIKMKKDMETLKIINPK